MPNTLWRTVAIALVGFYGGLGASADAPGSAGSERRLRLSRALHHGESETVELSCAAEGSCRLARRRNGSEVAEVRLPKAHADAMLASFFQLLPERPQRRTAGERELLLLWDVAWRGKRTEGRLDREERKLDEAYVDAVLSLEGALLAQFYGPNR